MRHRTRQGLTLIEVLILVVIVCILISIAIPRLTGNREKTAVAALSGELYRVADAQKAYHAANHRFAADLSELGFTPSNGVRLTLGGAGAASGTGWTATAEFAQTDGVKCHFAFGVDTVVDSRAVKPNTISCL